MPLGLGIRHFVNADTLAAGLSAFAPETVAREAGRIMLSRLRELADQREDFAFESTLASRTFAAFAGTLRDSGFSVGVAYVWLRSPELAIHRVHERVVVGGHLVPDDTVRRRYLRSLSNFRELYRPLADSWVVCDNSSDRLRPLAVGSRHRVMRVLDREGYEEFERGAAALDDPGAEIPGNCFTPHAVQCMERAVDGAVAEHHRSGSPLYVWRDGRIVRLFPDGSIQPV
jgi:predicted ABC-type ATPase